MLLAEAVWGELSTSQQVSVPVVREWALFCGAGWGGPACRMRAMKRELGYLEPQKASLVFSWSPCFLGVSVRAKCKSCLETSKVDLESRL
jgi:hypothetical protein